MYIPNFLPYWLLDGSSQMPGSAVSPETHQTSVTATLSGGGITNKVEAGHWQKELVSTCKTYTAELRTISRTVVNWSYW